MMRTLDQIWEACSEHGFTDELSRKLYNRIKKMARIVLRQLCILPFDKYYDDYMQDACVKFFELIDTFDPNKGKLEGYFITSFRHDMARELKRRRIEDSNLSLHPNIASKEPTPYSNVAVSDFITKLTPLLNDDERMMMAYFLDGIDDLQQIAIEESRNVDDMLAVFTTLKDKAERIIHSGKRYTDDSEYRKEIKERIRHENADGRDGV